MYRFLIKHSNYRAFFFVGLTCLAQLSCGSPVQEVAPKLLMQEFPNHQFFDIKIKTYGLRPLEQLLSDDLWGPWKKYYVAFSGSDPGILKRENGTDPIQHTERRNDFAPEGAPTGKEIGTAEVFSLQTAKDELTKIFPEEKETISRIDKTTAQCLWAQIPGDGSNSATCVEKVLLSDPASHRHYFVFCKTPLPGWG